MSMACRIFRQVQKKPFHLCERHLDQQFVRHNRLQQKFKSTVVVNNLTPKTETTLGTQTANGDGHPKIDLTFTNCEEAYKSKTNLQLFRAWLVLKLCSWSFLVDNNKALLNWSQKVLPKSLFHGLMKATFYGHFVAGEDQLAIRPLINQNLKFGVKSILDYSAEEDVSTEKAVESEIKGCVPEEGTDLASAPEHAKFHTYAAFGDRREGVVSSRTYFYEGEEQCDKHMKIFLDAIDGVSDATAGTGFCAVKLTALGRPQLLNDIRKMGNPDILHELSTSIQPSLLQMSDVLVSARNFFNKLVGEEGDNFSRGFREDEFLAKLTNMGVKMSQEDCSRWFSILDLTQDGQVDIMDWDNLLEVNMNLSKLLVVPDVTTGELVPLVTGLSEETEMEMKNMLHRVNRIAEYAVERDVRVMIDAEQSYFQPAISRLTMEMMKKFNKEKAYIFNTYQCYLKAAHHNITIDLDTARRNNFFFGCKLVRGAYMEQERERAVQIGYEDPINPTYEATSSMYHKVVREVMRQIQMRERGKIAVMIASHNEDTVKYTVEKMKEFDIKPSDRLICFGQLFGMCDQVSFPLGQSGYSVYKYTPYGRVEEVLPYLSRRAMENKCMLKKVAKEKKMIKQEMYRRLKSGQFMYEPMQHLPNRTNQTV